MSRLAQMRDRMKAVVADDQLAKQKEEAMKFRSFYDSAYYKVFKEGIEEQLAQLDRSPITDPSQLVLVQGQRNALMGILDGLNKKERMVNLTLRK